MKTLNLAALQKAFLKEISRIEKNLSKDLIYKDLNKLIDNHTESLQENYEKLVVTDAQTNDEDEVSEIKVIKESD